jgi:hypothetical protein
MTVGGRTSPEGTNIPGLQRRSKARAEKILI